VDFRPATADDLAGEFDVFERAQRQLYERRGGDWSGRDFSEWGRVQLHLLRHDGARSFVAEEAGDVVGFAAAWVRDDVWFLSALFVAPERQGEGIGRRLLGLAWGDGFRRRITITEALQPVSTASYARRGLMPTTPILNFEGQPCSVAPDLLEAVPPEANALRFLDQAAYGFDRAVDHTLWEQTADSATVWLESGEPAAYSYSSPGGLIGPLAGRDETSAARALRAELARRTDQTACVAIPGTSAQLVAEALASGLRMQDPGLLLLSPPAHSPCALAIHSYWLL
jgi:GNAT superfamily N-acetyltransferase